MPLLTFQRRPFWYAVAACGVVALHAGLCYPAAVSRGYPPMELPALISIFLGPMGMLLPPLFDDARNDEKRRLRRAACVAAGFCFIWGIVETNVSYVVPHIGHLVGMAGIVSGSLPEVVMRGAFWFLPALVFFYCLDGVAIGFWSLFRGFRSD